MGDTTVFKNLFASVDCFLRALTGKLPSMSPQMLPTETKVYKRSNYRRIEHGNYAWGFIPYITMEPITIRTHPNAYGLGRLFTDKPETVMTPEEMRSLAYTLLAAANSIDGRHKGERRKAPRTRTAPEFVQTTT
jgi:hypothetical protein